jgi:hypothetical protein
LLVFRVAAAAGLAALLAGCSFFGFGDDPIQSRRIEKPRVVRPAKFVQLAALPGYLSDEDLLPARPARATLGLLEAALRGYLSDEDLRPARPVLVPATARRSRHRRVLTSGDLVPQPPLPALTSLGSPLRAETLTLADLMEDQAWRKRTSRQLERLFQ